MLQQARNLGQAWQRPLAQAVNNTEQNVANRLNPWLQAFHFTPAQAQVMSPVVTPKAQLTTTPTPTPTPTSGVPTNAFSQFTTAPMRADYAPLIYQAAIKNGLNPNLLASVAFTEHGFSPTPGVHYNYDANGKIISEDVGPMQINLQAHPDVTYQQAINPQFAIPYGANLLRQYIQQAGGLSNGIAAYNVGVGGATVNGMGGQLGPKGQKYLNAVARGLTPQLVQQLGLHPTYK